MNKISLGFGDDDGKCFIHFPDKKQLKKFIYKNKSKMVTGNMCCSGKGIHIKRFNNKEVTTYDEISRIKRNYV